MVITFSGEFGSGFMETANILADYLSYPIYDEEVTSEVYQVGKNYMDEPTLRYYETSESRVLLDEVKKNCVSKSEDSNEIPSLSLDVLPLDLRLDNAIYGALSRFADKDNCIIIGRCANYYLRDRKNVVSVFFADSEDKKIERVMNLIDCDAATASKVISKVDKRRSHSYSYFTGEKWDASGSYDLRINGRSLNAEESAELIRTLVALKQM